jgi:CubicO group peptidase (beta-lactamase class C family)
MRARRSLVTLLALGCLAGAGPARTAAPEARPATTTPAPPAAQDPGSPRAGERFEAAIEAGRAAMRARMAGTTAPAMAVGVAVDGAVVWSEAFGMADAGSRRPATAATLFGLGSISKSFTMALAGRLVEQGSLDLDAPVERYLPAFPHRGRGITTRLIAGHLSGLDDAFSTANWLGTRHFPGTGEALVEIYRERLRSEPGSEFFYATGTYTLIAGVIETAAGTAFPDALRRHVLEPLRLDSIVLNDPRNLPPGLATFYLSGEGGRPDPAPPFDPSHKWAGAGLLGTAADVARFGAALSRPGYLKEETLRQIFTPLKTRDGSGTGTGLGWRVDARGGKEGSGIVYQPGGGPGISSWLAVDRERGVAVAILSNMTGAPVGGAHLDTILEEFARAAGAR